MAKQAMAIGKWRESASLIILARNKLSQHTDFDYRVLLFSRTEKASFMPNSSVFPGGVHESTDESPLWLDYFRSHGFGKEMLKQSSLVDGAFSRMFTPRGADDGLSKDMSLRITAIRETFEEMGILLCTDRKSVHKRDGFSSFSETFDRVHWQRLVHRDHSQFLTLCRELDVVPDLWSLQGWSAWLTPATFRKRFQTVFYIVALNEMPNSIPEKHEVADYAWKTPLEYLRAYENKELYLPPPQFYELSRLLNFARLDALMKFTCGRALKGVDLILPVQVICNDGMVCLYPGDDMYPSDPNACDTADKLNVSFEEHRKQAKQLHRAEFVNLNKINLHVNVVPPGGHVRPINLESLNQSRAV